MKEREFKAQADAKRKQANADATARAVAASSTAEAARAAQAHRHGLVVDGALGALMVAGLIVLYLLLQDFVSLSGGNHDRHRLGSDSGRRSSGGGLY